MEGSEILVKVLIQAQIIVGCRSQSSIEMKTGLSEFGLTFQSFSLTAGKSFQFTPFLVSCERACGDLVTEAGLASAAGD